MKPTPLLSSGQWATFLAYGAALAGLALISPKLASVVGVGTIVVLVIKNAGGLGFEPTKAGGVTSFSFQ